MSSCAELSATAVYHSTVAIPVANAIETADPAENAVPCATLTACAHSAPTPVVPVGAAIPEPVADGHTGCPSVQAAAPEAPLTRNTPATAYFSAEAVTMLPNWSYCGLLSSAIPAPDALLAGVKADPAATKPPLYTR